MIALSCYRSDFHLQVKVTKRSAARHSIDVHYSSVDTVIFSEWSWQVIFNYLCMIYHAQLACCDERGKVTQHLNCAMKGDLQKVDRLFRAWARTGEYVCLNVTFSPFHLPVPGKCWHRNQLPVLSSVVSVGQLCHMAHEIMIAAPTWALTTALWKMNISKICVQYINYSQDCVT